MYRDVNLNFTNFVDRSALQNFSPEILEYYNID